jgi:hypothetical protein
MAGMHAVLCCRFDIVKVLPLHEVKRATAVKMMRYGYPFGRVRRIFDFPKHPANRTSNPQGRFFGGIEKGPEEVAACVDPVSGLVTTSFTLRRFAIPRFFVTQEES